MAAAVSTDISRTISVAIRPLYAQDFGQLAALTGSIPWGISLEELKMIHEAYPGSCIGSFAEDGTLLSHIHLNLASPEVAYIGLFVTSAPYRGRGIGIRLFQHAMRQAGQRVVILDAVMGKDTVYMKSGFSLSNVKVLRVQGDVCIVAGIEKDPAISVSTIEEKDIDDVAKYDESIACCKRQNFISSLVNSNTSKCLLARHVSSTCVLGYIIMRPDYISVMVVIFR